MCAKVEVGFRSVEIWRLWAAVLSLAVAVACEDDLEWPSGRLDIGVFCGVPSE